MGSLTLGSPILLVILTTDSPTEDDVVRVMRTGRDSA
jgi:hypothetical protein